MRTSEKHCMRRPVIQKRPGLIFGKGSDDTPYALVRPPLRCIASVRKKSSQTVKQRQQVKIEYRFFDHNHHRDHMGSRFRLIEQAPASELTISIASVLENYSRSLLFGLVLERPSMPHPERKENPLQAVGVQTTTFLPKPSQSPLVTLGSK